MKARVVTGGAAHRHFFDVGDVVEVKEYKRISGYDGALVLYEARREPRAGQKENPLTQILEASDFAEIVGAHSEVPRTPGTGYE